MRLALVAGVCLALVPCWWQPHVQAGDLSSHVYNAWLAGLIESGRAPGLVIVPQWTNVLFDHMLVETATRLGALGAERVCVSIVVLTFVSGALAFVAELGGRSPAASLPAVVMLAYGWAFHAGLLNFVLGLGLALWALAIAWRPTGRRITVALVCLAASFTAHALPPLWAVTLFGFVAISRSSRHSGDRLTLAAPALLVALGRIGAAVVPSGWTAGQFLHFGGVTQLVVYDAKYAAPAAALGVLWAISLGRLVRERGSREVADLPAFRIWLLTSVAIVALPEWVAPPGPAVAFEFIAERLSLAAGVAACALVASARLGRLESLASFAVCVAFFALLYRDDAALNALEARMREAVLRLPAGARVVNGIWEESVPMNPLRHALDRACVGHCFSYGNYEPASRMFRIRASGDNPIVLSSIADCGAAEVGEYLVKERDLPLHVVEVDARGEPRVRPLEAGAKTGITFVRVIARR